jgi:hypothetical protein
MTPDTSVMRLQILVALLREVPMLGWLVAVMSALTVIFATRPLLCLVGT